MATTTNFGWSTPDNTDLVKDGALAIRTLGSAIDTSMGDLRGGTTGQVLSKNSNTDMDFVWVTENDADAIQNSIVDAKGDLISATADNTPARLASSGVNGQVLTVDTSTSTGLKWADPAGDITAVNTNSPLTGGGTSGSLTLSYDYAAGSKVTLNDQTATYTVVLADADQKLVRMNVSTANDFQIPTDANVDFAIGSVINVTQLGTGQTTIKAVTSGTTTLVSTGATAASPKLRARYSAASCIKTAANTWLIIGDLA